MTVVSLAVGRLVPFAFTNCEAVCVCCYCQLEAEAADLLLHTDQKLRHLTATHPSSAVAAASSAGCSAAVSVDSKQGRHDATQVALNANPGVLNNQHMMVTSKPKDASGTIQQQQQSSASSVVGATTAATAPNGVHATAAHVQQLLSLAEHKMEEAMAVAAYRGTPVSSSSSSMGLQPSPAGLSSSYYTSSRALPVQQPGQQAAATEIKHNSMSGYQAAPQFSNADYVMPTNAAYQYGGTAAAVVHHHPHHHPHPQHHPQTELQQLEASLAMKRAALVDEISAAQRLADIEANRR